MRKKIFVVGILIVFLAFGFTPLFASKYCWDCSYTKGDSSKTYLEQTYYFGGCNFGATSLEYCPHPLVEKKYSCKTICNTCCNDPKEYKNCGTQGCDSGSFTITGHPCGSSYDEGTKTWTTTSWTTIDTRGWICPAAKILAKLYTPNPLSLNFNKISAGGKDSNSVLRSGESTSFYFTAYIPACVNRVPMLSLKVKLRNATGVVNEEYGIYTKHQTINYTEEKNGVIEGFEIPEQQEFKKTYTLKAVLKGYRPWAWRQQFVEAVEKAAEVETDWNDLPGEIPATPKRVGDLYFSKDFLAPLMVGEGPTCTGVTESTISCPIDTYTLDLSTGGGMCTYQDLADYVSENGLTSDLENKIRTNCNIGADTTIKSVSVNPLTSYVEVTGNIVKMSLDVSSYFGKGESGSTTTIVTKTKVNVTKYFGKNNTEFKTYAETPSNYDSIFNTLFSNNIITDNELRDLTGIQNDYFFNYDTTVNKIEVPTLYEDNQSADIKLNLTINWTTTGMKNTKFEEYASNPSNYQTIYDTLYSNGVITASDLESLITSYISTVCTKDGCEPHTPADCNSYTPTYTFKKVNSITTSNLQGEKKLDVTLNISLNWTSDIDADLSVTKKFTYNCAEGWTWGNISELKVSSLAKCLYNFDKCLGKKKDGYYEIAAAGYGPMEATPTLETNIGTIKSDGGLGSESNTITVTVYRSCSLTDKWIDPTGTYACPQKIYTKGSGKLEKETGSGEYLVIKNGTNIEAKKLDKIKINNSLTINGMKYDYDVNEGDQYYVLKCAYNPDVSEESTLAIKAEIGTIIELNDNEFYICQKSGWTPIS